MQFTGYRLQVTARRYHGARSAPLRAEHAGRGLTTLELLMSLLVLIAVLTAIVTALRYSYSSSRYVFEQSDATRTARIGLERMVRELREAAYAQDGAYPILSISANAITFYSDTDHDSDIEKVRYTLSGGTLVRGDTKPTGTPPVYTSPETVGELVQFVRNEALSESLFTYYDADSNEITDYSRIGDVAAIDVKLIVNLYPSRAPEDYELRSSATLRNVVSQ